MKPKKSRTKIDTIKNRKKLKKKAEALLHYYIRKRARNFQDLCECYTCYKLVPFDQTNAGHRHHGKLDLDERNLRVQCIRCNHHLSGNLGEYERRLIKENGIEWAENLKRDADRDLKSYTYDELKEIIKKYKDLIKNL